MEDNNTNLGQNQNFNQEASTQQPNYQQAPPNTGGYQKGPVGEIRSPVTVLLLSIVTCGIYGIIWMYKVSQEINDYTRAELTKPNYAWIGLFCFVFYYINVYKIDQAIVQIDKIEGRYSESKFLIWILLSVFFGIGSLIMYYQVQDSLNRIWASNGAHGNQPQF